MQASKGVYLETKRELRLPKKMGEEFQAVYYKCLENTHYNFNEEIIGVLGAELATEYLSEPTRVAILADQKEPEFLRLYPVAIAYNEETE